MASTAARRIVVGVDGSPPSHAALAWALEEAQRSGRDVHAVMAWRPSMGAAPAARPAGGVRSLEEQQRDAQQLLERTVKAVAGPSNAVRSQVAHGSGGTVLAAAASGADLVVVGRHGGRLTARLPGSVLQYLLREAPCPVVVVPDEPAT